MLPLQFSHCVWSAFSLMLWVSEKIGFNFEKFCINKYTEWNVWCYPMSSLDLHEAWSGLFVTELNWACMRTCEMLVKDILGKWYILVPSKERKCVWGTFLWGFALVSAISWYPQKGRRRRETSVRDWELSQARKQNLNEGKTWVAQESCSTSLPQPHQHWVNWLRSCGIKVFIVKQGLTSCIFGEVVPEVDGQWQ